MSYGTDQILLFAAICLLCAGLPRNLLVAASLVGVLLADTHFVPWRYIYLSRFAPMGVLFVRALAQTPSGASRPGIRYGMARAWAPFLFLAALSTAYSLEPSMTLQRSLAGVLLIVGFSVGIPALFGVDRRSIRPLMLTMFVVMGSMVLYGLYLSSIGAGKVSAAGTGLRRTAVFTNPNTTGLIAMEALFCGFYLVQTARRGAQRVVLALAAVGIGVALVLSGSRTSVSGSLVGMFVLARGDARLTRGRYRVLLGSALFVGIVFAAADLLFPDFAGAYFRDAATSQRFPLMQRDWHLAQSNIWFGVGFGGSDGLYDENVRLLRSEGVTVWGSHCSQTKLLVELGIAGVVLAASAFFVLLRRIVKNLPRFEDPRLGRALLAGVAAGLTTSVSEAWLFGFGNSSTLPFWLMLAVLSALSDDADTRGPRWGLAGSQWPLRSLAGHAAPAAYRAPVRS